MHFVKPGLKKDNRRTDRAFTDRPFQAMIAVLYKLPVELNHSKMY